MSNFIILALGMINSYLMVCVVHLSFGFFLAETFLFALVVVLVDGYLRWK